MDPIQASFLCIKLKYLDLWNERSKTIAESYLDELKDLGLILPIVEEFNSPVWHLFCIRSSNRDNLRQELLNKGVETLIHYPIPPYAQKAYQHLEYENTSFPVTSKIAGELLSLPVGPFMEDYEVNKVIDSLKCILPIQN